MVDKETWTIGVGCDKMEKLIKYNMHVQYHKRVFLKKKKKKAFSGNKAWLAPWFISPFNKNNVGAIKNK